MTTLIKSKTFWTGLASIATGVGLIIAGDGAAGAPLIAQGLIAIFLRQAITNQGPQK